MKLNIIGAAAALIAFSTGGALASESVDRITVEATPSTICLDTRLTYEGAKACKEQMAEADSEQERQEVMARFASRIDGHTPLRNSLTSSGAGVKNATPAPSDKID